MFCDRVPRFLTAVCKKAIEKSPDPGRLTLREVAKPFERSPNPSRGRRPSKGRSIKHDRGLKLSCLRFCDRVLRFLTAVCKKAIEKSPDPGRLTLREVAKPFERSPNPSRGRRPSKGRSIKHKKHDRGLKLSCFDVLR